jgi:4-hydroxy-tetrahydrodipicolinate reductase
MKICMAGAYGRMGRRILEMAAAAPDITIGGAFDTPALVGATLTVGVECGQPETVTLATPEDALAGVDAMIDFTGAEVCVANVQRAAALGIPAIVGTTGLDEAAVAALRACAAQVPVVYAPNMSVGVNLLFKLVREVAEILGQDYNCEIVEIHHNQKKDAPSGTAVRLAERAAEGLGLTYGDVVHGREGMVGARPRAEIGMHTMRGGDVVGEHTVCFIGAGERIELTHKAHNRDNFARGSLVAARFAVKAAPGLYDMQDVLGLK